MRIQWLGIGQVGTKEILLPIGRGLIQAVDGYLKHADAKTGQIPCRHVGRHGKYSVT